LDDLLQSFKTDEDKYNWETSVEGSVKEYLGISINDTTFKNKEGKESKAYKLTQEGLITKILETTGMKDCNGKSTPTSNESPLGTDTNGSPPRFQDKWSYASVIGMMM